MKSLPETYIEEVLSNDIKKKTCHGFSFEADKFLVHPWTGKTVKCIVELSEQQAEHLFYSLWEYLEDDTFKELIGREGFKLVKKTPKRQGG